MLFYYYSQFKYIFLLLLYHAQVSNIRSISYGVFAFGNISQHEHVRSHLQMPKEWDNITTATNQHTEMIHMEVAMTISYGYDSQPVYGPQQPSYDKLRSDYSSQSSYSDYSDYKTKDKKYECRTGHFEGFFVSSVEFGDAKHDKRFDDKKDRER